MILTAYFIPYPIKSESLTVILMPDQKTISVSFFAFVFKVFESSIRTFVNTIFDVNGKVDRTSAYLASLETLKLFLFASQQFQSQIKTDASFFRGLMQRNFFKVSKQLSHKNPVVHYANKDDGCKFPKLACFVKNICILSAFISVHFFKICFLNIFFKVCNRSPNFPCN